MCIGKTSRSAALCRIAVILAVSLALAVTASSRASVDVNTTRRPATTQALAAPAFCIAEHNVGKLVLSVGNHGTMGTGFYLSSLRDCFTGRSIESCEYPQESNNKYLFSTALWLGAVVGRDTLVSTAADGWVPGLEEMFPDEYPNGNMIRRSTLDPLSSEYAGAVSEQDFIAVFTDTFTSGVPGLGMDEVDGRPHTPLNVEVTRSSHAWSYVMSEDIILLDYQIRNIGEETLDQFYVGFYVDADIYHKGVYNGFDDDLTGFVHEAPIVYGGGCEFDKDMNIAWAADEDGDLSTSSPVRDVTGLRVLRTPSDSVKVSYNWWVSNGSSSLDFGPQTKANLRNLGFGQTGTPSGDRSKYFVLSNGEFDYDQVFTGTIGLADPVWAYPNQAIAQNVSNGYDTRYLLSFGPFVVRPGETLPFVLAYVAGEYFHVQPDNARDNLYLAYNPGAYYSNLNFQDLIYNSLWAEWIYDNPGVDTDSDGYAGEFLICYGDTMWVGGDGVPDYRAADAPPGPVTWLDGHPRKLHVRFNGLRSETAEDIFSHRTEFEGYNIYLSSDGSPGSFAKVATYDAEDFIKYVERYGRWEVIDDPMSLRDLRCAYGASCDDESFNPLDYTAENPYQHHVFWDSIFYFEPYLDNANECGVTTSICKKFPDQPYPSSLNPRFADPWELTDDGYLKYFEYEAVIDGLLPEQCYFVSVTAYDFGTTRSGTPPLESNLFDNVREGCVPHDLTVAVDFKPGYCPNPFGVKFDYQMSDEAELGDAAARLITEPTVQVAVCGTSALDVGDIDGSTVHLEGIPASKMYIRDVATPVPETHAPCACNSLGVDGITDLVLLFSYNAILEVMGEVYPGQSVELTLTGRTQSGLHLEGSDCFLIAAPVKDEPEIPLLLGNHPNPFNPTTEIRFYLPEAGHISLTVLNVLGQHVTTLVNGRLGAGEHSVSWTAGDVSSGVYFYRLQVGGDTQTRKMVLIK